jgi:ATP-dependent DNA helicase RecG
MNFKLANIVQDRAMLDVAKTLTSSIIDTDPDLSLADNLPTKNTFNLKQVKQPGAKYRN